MVNYSNTAIIPVYDVIPKWFSSSHKHESPLTIIINRYSFSISLKVRHLAPSSMDDRIESAIIHLFLHREKTDAKVVTITPGNVVKVIRNLYDLTYSTAQIVTSLYKLASTELSVDISPPHSKPSSLVGNRLRIHENKRGRFTVEPHPLVEYCINHFGLIYLDNRYSEVMREDRSGLLFKQLSWHWFHRGLESPITISALEFFSTTPFGIDCNASRNWSRFTSVLQSLYDQGIINPPSTTRVTCSETNRRTADILASISPTESFQSLFLSLNIDNSPIALPVFARQTKSA